GYALTQSNLVIFSVFLSLGLGLAFPFILLAKAPNLLSWLPRPGAWMVAFRQFLAFPMLLSVAWLLWVLSAQTSRFDVFLVLCGLIGISFTIWLYQKIARINYVKSFVVLAFAVVSFLPLWIMEPMAEPKIALPNILTLKDIKPLLAKHKKLFVYATADWCIICKVNEETTLSTSEMKHFFKDNDITEIKLDWTNQDKEITEYLDSF